ncbi:MAG: arsenate reductase ArsC [Candidatus Thermoplasmatota archaeon]|nr:arsenate reductase ArsC [Candidatus Thermoplasmatota archaeon]MEC7364836.1 arsenate reductase ArsC [Candidatus Thermoplasmatota archaeon]
MRLLFVCVGNTCRSQMAEAIARDLGHSASSAGTHPPEDRGVAPNALIVLEEISIDTKGLHPKSVDLVDPENFDKIISMGCGVSCPALPIDEDWGLEDPFGREIEAYRKTRDEIRARVNAIVDRSTDA